MTWLRPIPENIPSDLRNQPWVLWRGESRGPGKPTKVPYQPRHQRRKASSTDPATWSSFAAAVEVYRAVDVDGLGAVLTGAITCIDLDHVIDESGGLDHRAQTIVDRCNSFTEISPSGMGLHIFVIGRVPRPLKGDMIEVYSTERYIAVTGHRWPGTPAELRDQQAYLDHLVRLADRDRPTGRVYHGTTTAPPDDLAGELLAKLQTWGVPVARLKPWSDGYLVELVACPFAADHTTDAGGAAVAIHASGAYDFMCLHQHCDGRDWRDFRRAMEGRR